MGALIRKIDDWIGRFANWAGLWTILSGVGVVSGATITGWIASGTAWIDQYGALGWWFSALAGGLAAALILLTLAGIRYAWIRASVIRKWGRRVDTINPVDSEFHKKRIKLSDIAHPANNRIRRKRFIDCELLGPANVVVTGKSQLSDISAYNCDLVVTKSNCYIYNVIVLEDIEIIGGILSNLTIYLQPDLVPTFVAMGSRDFVTLTGDPQIDNRPPKGIERKTQQ